MRFMDTTAIQGWYGMLCRKNNMHTLEKVHGHGGRTRVEWIDKEDE